MTLATIINFTNENNLIFILFETEGNILLAYKHRFPNDPAASNLEQWEIFEHENPDTFLGMYQFWVQKVA